MGSSENGNYVPNLVFHEFNQTTMDWFKFSTAPFIDTSTQTVPIYQRNTNFDVEILASHPGPASLHSMTWEGDYTPMNHKRV